MSNAAAAVRLAHVMAPGFESSGQLEQAHAVVINREDMERLVGHEFIPLRHSSTVESPG